MYAAMMNTALGTLLIKANEDAITTIHFMHDGEAVPELVSNALTDLCILQLGEYLNGQRNQFSVPIKPTGTLFQQRVWKALQEIPYGNTCSYGDIARKLGNPRAARAIGMANNRNPIPIVIPCHRVVGRNGQLTGYSGGLPQKNYLLNLERKPAVA
ncbi:methylated-DNA--[protein]-cysteine S-methyltransferase [Neptuniibacter sp. CAU 1671]|uniref:methylated-DNA--[protein]-cysteine S-methyltransferase n=1 Tax=Neptuniibacter sp. CAU 1671 TaxID=3032593 RepID=UPI0023D9A27E|nr:methylated-DNA--[protein]-cysteine S-methyltransferase [Neptuniibacter sp. CAU 1671]MDF2182012.1 methylated-DNA--[protein]-cysteine S-methyltransferase [Neptuniibacter sp. CAU 1671]